MLNLTNKQLLGLFMYVCIALCTIVAHKTAVVKVRGKQGNAVPGPPKIAGQHAQAPHSR